MLSSQTKDEVTDAAVSKLREAVGGTLTVDAILAADEKVIAEAIAKVGFWRRKTQLAPIFLHFILSVLRRVSGISSRPRRSLRMSLTLTSRRRSMSCALCLGLDLRWPSCASMSLGTCEAGASVQFPCH